MAISKLMHCNESSASYRGRHLKYSIGYITDKAKTQDGRLVGAVNCQPGRAYEQMRETKKLFGKTDKRQGYHFIISFPKGEADCDTAYEFTQRFINEYLGKEYEAVFAVHDNTEHIHSHIVFNSVSFLTGKKYHYKKGDWAKEIQPVVNSLCREYGLSILEIDGGAEKGSKPREWSQNRDGPFVWSDMIKRDVDACILQAYDYESFLGLLMDKGYGIKRGKYTAVRPPGMERCRRLKTLGGEYEEERIKERIRSEHLSAHKKQDVRTPQPKVVKCCFKGNKRAGLSGLQKRYFARLYRTGKLKKRAYSRAWKYRDDIKEMERLQKQYIFLVRNHIRTMQELESALLLLAQKKKETAAAAGKISRERNRFKGIFDAAGELEELKGAERMYQSGDDFFAEEHARWQELSARLEKEGYTPKEVLELSEHYRQAYRDACRQAADARRELETAESIHAGLSSSGSNEKAQPPGIQKRTGRTAGKDRKPSW